MPPRFHVDLPLGAEAAFALPAGAARHVQVLRLQPGDPLVLFDGRGGEWAASVTSMGRNAVEVRLGGHDPVERELDARVTIALGMPAGDRMDFVVEKATELGASRIQPLVCDRSVLRPEGERAAKKVAHWQAVATAAAEQSGRTRVPAVEPVLAMPRWLDALGGAGPASEMRWQLVPASAHALGELPRPAAGERLLVLSGPEGGWSTTECAMARTAGFVEVSLGTRILRADTAPVAVLAWLGLAGVRTLSFAAHRNGPDGAGRRCAAGGCP